MFKTKRKAILFVLICFAVYSFLANLTIFTAEAFGENSLALLDDVYVAPEPETSEVFKFPVGTKISDAISHPTEPVIFAADSSNSKVYSVNVETGTVEEISLDGTIERMDYFDDELFVTILTDSHSPYWYEEDQSGAIAVIDTKTMELKERIDIDIDPYDIVAGRDGYLYVPSGSGQWTHIKSYSRSTKELTGASTIYNMSFVEYHPTLNRIYANIHKVSPRKYQAFDIENGEFVSSHESAHSGEYIFAANFKISPDGKYIFDGSGNILTCSEDETQDMNFFFKLDKSFIDIAFALDYDLFFTSSGDKQINVYCYSTLSHVHSIDLKGDILKLFNLDGKLIALSDDGKGELIFEKIQVELSPIKRIDLENYNIKDSIIHDKRPIIYFVDNTDNKLVSMNYITGQIKESDVSCSPNCLDIYNGEIYVGCGENEGIYIYDDDTLTLNEQIIIDTTFDDMAIGNDGFIYTLGSNCVRSFSRTSNEEISRMNLIFSGRMEKHPDINVFYFTREKASPQDIHTIEYNNGNIINTGESPYHAHYSIDNINRISPDGKLLFNSSGNIFTISINPEYDIRYVSKLENGFSDACFDGENNLLFTANSNIVDIYDCSTLTKLVDMDMGNKPSYVFYKDGILFSLASDSLETVTSEELSAIIPPTTTPTPAPGIMLPFNATITDAIEHPEKPVIFAVDAANSKVYSVNIETGEIKEALIDGAIERLDYQNDTLYVTIANRRYNPYGDKEEWSRAIVIIDADTMEVENKFELDIDPFDIVAGRDGIIYVSSGFGQWDSINSYSPGSNQSIDQGDIRHMSFAELHPILNRIYTINTDLSPRDYKAYDVDDGKFVSSHDSPYHGDYKLATNYKISPDGKYLFNGSGVIFTCSEDKTKDMSFAFEFDKAFSDITFNIEENKFYTTDGDNQIYVYNYEDFEKVDTMSSIGEISKLFYVNGKLCALSKNDNGMPMFEVIKQPKIIYGDVNQDGEVNSTDLTYLKRYILKKGIYELDEYSFSAADVNGDGYVNSIDLTYIKRYVLRKILEFPVSRK